MMPTAITFSCPESSTAASCDPREPPPPAQDLYDPYALRDRNRPVQGDRRAGGDAGERRRLFRDIERVENKLDALVELDKQVDKGNMVVALDTSGERAGSAVATGHTSYTQVGHDNAPSDHDMSTSEYNTAAAMIGEDALLVDAPE
jgi:hypothetical protein